MRAAGGELARPRVLWLMGQVLERRAAQPRSWPGCEACGQRLQSKAGRPGSGPGWVGTVRWKRRVGRCPRGCTIGQVAPLDQALGLGAYTRTSGVLQEMACL
jgi:hypothetical protein